MIFELGFAHARNEQREIGVRAPVQRQVDDFAGGHHFATVARIGLQHLRRPGDGDLLGAPRHLEAEIHALPGIHCDGEAFGGGSLEPGFLAVRVYSPIQTLRNS